MSQNQCVKNFPNFDLLDHLVYRAQVNFFVLYIDLLTYLANSCKALLS